MSYVLSSPAQLHSPAPSSSSFTQDPEGAFLITTEPWVGVRSVLLVPMRAGWVSIAWELPLLYFCGSPMRWGPQGHRLCDSSSLLHGLHNSPGQKSSSLSTDGIMAETHAGSSKHLQQTDSLISPLMLCARSTAVFISQRLKAWPRTHGHQGESPDCNQWSPAFTKALL